MIAAGAAFSPAAAGQVPIDTFEAVTQFANHGSSVAGAGDVDHDGVPDVLVGTMLAFPAQQSPGGAGAGAGAISPPVVLPATAAGATATVQAFVGDGGTAPGLASSGGLELSL